MVKTVNTETFISNALEVHSGFYDYSKVDYKNSKTKVIITCPVHGDFEQTPSDHLRKKGCKQCKLDKQKITFEQFEERAKELHNNKYSYIKDSYITIKDKLSIICPIHGEFLQTGSIHSRGHGCPKCAKESTKLGIDKFIEKSIELYGNRYDYSKVNYINNCTNVILICSKHGEFEVTPNNHLHGQNCKLCNYDSYKLSLSEFINKANNKHNNKYNYSKVDYVNSKTNVIIICPEHGEFLQTPNSHLQGSECPKCKLKAQTKLFNKLKSKFKNEEILWETTPYWLGRQRFDIYFPKYNIAVEYNGEQHYQAKERFGGDEGYEKCLERDELKRQKCLDNNCNLFELKYNYKEIDFEQLTIDILTIIKSFKNES